jgi:hypothetical protein
MRSRPLFELSVVGVFPQLFYFCITVLGSQAAYIRFSYEFKISFFTFLNQLLHKIFLPGLHDLFILDRTAVCSALTFLTLLCLGKEKSGLVDFDALLLTKNVV